MLKNQGRFSKSILTTHGRITFERTMLIGVDKANTKALKKPGLFMVSRMISQSLVKICVFEK